MIEILKKELNAPEVSLFIWKSDNVFLPYFTANSSHFNPLDLSENEISELLMCPVSLKEDGSLAALLDEEAAPIAILRITGLAGLSESFFAKLAESCSRFLNHYKKTEKLIVNERKFEQLYKLTEKFHSTMNKDEVLGELMSTLQKMYENSLFYLFLSHDNHKGNLPVKDLYFDENGTNDTAMEAYLTGMVKEVKSKEYEQSIYYIPLKGQQGIYGVLEVLGNSSNFMEQSEVKFLTMLASAAGNAMENAQLYEQSKKLVEDLQLINETTHQLNKNLRLTDTMEYMSERIIKSFSAQEVGFFYCETAGAVQPLPGSTSFFNKEESFVYLDFVKTRIEQEKDGVFIGSLSAYLQKTEYECLMGVPMMETDGVRGYAIILHNTPYHFTFEMFKLLQSLIHHSSLAMANSLLREELEMLVKTDHLTKLYSRKFLNECIQRSMQMDTQGTFILIDIDNFKQVNDTFGHQVGDEVIIQVANLMKLNIREQDVGCRWGGEELAIYLPKVDLESGVSIAERLVSKVAQSTVPPITISCGVAHWTAETDDSEKRLFRRADRALYSAKSLGKNRVIFQDKARIAE
ncbi:sensor domain-containing diguanylate cyclase [Metabacillus sp. RGM 3146]|uniref:sensor domain-containing diguanylate cyclase n=1 Tax=Metabacillus sp. RGM 3146 TaxID=3401092 RepID=UPI003B9AF48A